MTFLELLLFLSLFHFAKSVLWQPCASISTDHADALEAWLAAAASTLPTTTKNSDNSTGLRGFTSTPTSPNQHHNRGQRLSVLHVDHHSDINPPEHYIPKGIQWYTNQTTRNHLTATADLASFQLSAVWGGLIDRIIWIKPNFNQHKHHQHHHHQHQHHQQDISNETHLLYYNSTCKQFNADTFVNAMASEQKLLSAKKMQLETEFMQSETYQFNEVRIDQLLVETPGQQGTKSFQNQKQPKELPRNIKTLVDLMGLHFRTNEQPNAPSRPTKDDTSKPFILDIDLDYFVPEERYAGTPPWANVINLVTRQSGAGMGAGEPNPFGKLAIASCRPEIMQRCPNGQWADPACPVWQALLDIQRQEWYSSTSNTYDKDGQHSENKNESVSPPCFHELRMMVQKITRGKALKQLQCLRHIVSPAEWVLWAKLLHDQPSTVHRLLATKKQERTTFSEGDEVGEQEKKHEETSSFRSVRRDRIKDYMQSAAQGTIQLQTMVDELGALLLLLPTVPVVISIARSTDYWTPVSEYAAIEVAVLRMLRSVYGSVEGANDMEYYLHGEQISNHEAHPPTTTTAPLTGTNRVETFGTGLLKMFHTFSQEELEHVNMNRNDSMMCSKNSKGATPNVDMINGIMQCSNAGNPPHSHRNEL